jgi:hypothetical protein
MVEMESDRRVGGPRKVRAILLKIAQDNHNVMTAPKCLGKSRCVLCHVPAAAADFNEAADTHSRIETQQRVFRSQRVVERATIAQP